MMIIFVPLLAAGALSSGIFAAQLLIISARIEITPFEQFGLAAGESWIC
jgi:hypothetical protein